jgi:hypothetical protein
LRHKWRRQFLSQGTTAAQVVADSVRANVNYLREGMNMLHFAIYLQMALLNSGPVIDQMPVGAPIRLEDKKSDPGKDITDDPHGPDPHGPDPHDEVHDQGLPANDPARNPDRDRDPYGNPKSQG